MGELDKRRAYLVPKRFCRRTPAEIWIDRRINSREPGKAAAEWGE